VKRLPFLDWMRGLAVLIMIECHTFNSFTRVELRDSSGYILSQFVGGMAAVLFLFLAGVTFAFQMESAARRGLTAAGRWRAALRRGGYILGIAYLFRLSNWAFSFGGADWHELLKVDILNCMGLGMVLLAPLAIANATRRVEWALLAGLAVAVAAPLVSGIAWGATPAPLKEYLAPNRLRFPLFPWAAYLAFGMAAGSILRQLAPERLERALQWGVLIGFALVFGGQYAANLPYSLYAKSDFWTDSPALIVMRVGMSLIAAGGVYLWTEYGMGGGWSWMISMGQTSLLVYWVHVVLVYGPATGFMQRALTVPQAATAVAGVTASMVALSAARLRRSRQRAAGAARATAPIGV
jgi:uncharacterized membrane protein